MWQAVLRVCAAQLSAYFLIKTLPFWAQLNGECEEGGRTDDSVYNVTHFVTCNVQRATVENLPVDSDGNNRIATKMSCTVVAKRSWSDDESI